MKSVGKKVRLEMNSDSLLLLPVVPTDSSNHDFLESNVISTLKWQTYCLNWVVNDLGCRGGIETGLETVDIWRSDRRSFGLGVSKTTIRMQNGAKEGRFDLFRLLLFFSWNRKRVFQYI